jgi:hypothetical protein
MKNCKSGMNKNTWNVTVSFAKICARMFLCTVECSLTKVWECNSSWGCALSWCDETFQTRSWGGLGLRFKLQEKFGVVFPWGGRENHPLSFGCFEAQVEAEVVVLWFINRMRYICKESFEWWRENVENVYGSWCGLINPWYICMEVCLFTFHPSYFCQHFVFSLKHHEITAIQHILGCLWTWFVLCSLFFLNMVCR